MDNQKIFVTGTMRTGSSLVDNVLSMHSKILVLSDGIHFFRFVYKSYEPLNEKNIERMLLHQRARLFHRFGIELDTKGVLKNILERGIGYPVIYDEIMKYYLARAGSKKTIWGDDPALQWREISVFVNFFPKAKVIHIYRDPRAIMSSWKQTCGIEPCGYLNSIFNSIDNLNHISLYSDSLSSKSYFPLKFEAISSEPEKWVRKLCDFLEVEYEDQMIQSEKWEGALAPQKVDLGSSSFDGTVTGFSKDRANRWKNVIEKWELCLVESMCGDLLKKYGYELSGEKFSPSDFRTAMDKIRSNSFLLKQYSTFLATGEGSDKYPLDPKDYRTWGVPGPKGHKSGWFKDSPKAKDYLKEIETIEARFAKR